MIKILKDMKTMGASTIDMSNIGAVKRELKAFIKYPKENFPTLLDKYDCIIWAQVAKSFKSAANLGMLFVIIAASSSSVERAFSRANIVVTPDKNRLTPVTVESLMICNSNEDLFLRVINEVNMRIYMLRVP